MIANPETKGMCADSHLGEVRHVILMLYNTTIMIKYLLMYLVCIFVFQISKIWVNSPHNGSGYFMTGEDSQTEDRFNAKLTTGGLGETGATYARTGYLGFIKRTDFTQTDGGEMCCTLCITNFKSEGRFICPSWLQCKGLLSGRSSNN